MDTEMQHTMLNLNGLITLEDIPLEYREDIRLTHLMPDILQLSHFMKHIYTYCFLTGRCQIRFLASIMWCFEGGPVGMNLERYLEESDSIEHFIRRYVEEYLIEGGVGASG